MTTSFKGWSDSWGASWGPISTDPNAMYGSVTFTVVANGTLVSPSGSRLKQWNGTSWVAFNLSYWNGNIWQEKPLKYWNGSSWI